MKLRVAHQMKRIAAKGSPTLVMLHGWGSRSEVWQALVECLPESLGVLWLDLPGFGDNPVLTLDSFCEQFEQVVPDNAVLLGWSLGGMLAVRLAAQSNKLAGIITIGANACFVAKDSWPQAMTCETFDQFVANFREDSGATYNRFLMLQSQGDKRRKRVMQQLKAVNPMPESEQYDGWLRGLNWLGEWDNRALLGALIVPQLHIFGQGDQLVPSACAQDIRNLNSQASVTVLGGVGHVPHISAPERVVGAIQPWLDTLSCGQQRAGVEQCERSKEDVAKSFSRAACVYDRYAHLQQRVATNLISMQTEYYGALLDVGCGTGFCMEHLSTACEALTGVDLSPGMLDVARAKQLPKSRYLCADMEAMPLPENSFDYIVSSLSIQWSENLPRLFKEFARVMKPGATALVATLGPETLHELRQAWQQVNRYTHVNRFDSVENLTSAIETAGLLVNQFERQPTPVYYANAMGLMRELKAIGAHNVNKGKNQGLTGRRQIEVMTQAYESFRQADGQLPATYDVFYFKLSKPA